MPLDSASVTAIPANAGLLKITFHSLAVKFALVAIVSSCFGTEVPEKFAVGTCWLVRR
jgi:hypothetical protein